MRRGKSGRTHSNRDAPLRARESLRTTQSPDPGQAITKAVMQEFVATLDIPEQARQSLIEMTPASYIGNATEQARGL